MYRTLNLLLAALLLTACQRRTLEDIVYDDSNLHVDVDWLAKFGQQPHGMTFALWDATDGGTLFIDETNTVGSHELPLLAGCFNVLLFNLTATELPCYRFDLGSYGGSSVTLRTDDERQHEEWDADFTFARKAVPLGIARDTVTVTDDMLTGGYAFREHPKTRSAAVQQGDDWYYRETPEDETSLLSVRIRVLGIKNLGTVEGGLSGMAAQYLMGRQQTGHPEISHLLEKAEWHAVLDAGDDSKDGWLSADIRVLGLPDSHVRSMADRDAALNHLTLSFLLADGKTPFRFDRDVGNLIRYVDEREVTDVRSGGTRSESYYVDYPTRHLFLVVSSVPLPDLPDVDRVASGFDAEVDPWGDQIITGVDM